MSTPSTAPAEAARPVTQERNIRDSWPAFAKDLPRWTITPDPKFQLIPEDRLQAILAGTDPAVAQQIRADMNYLDKELLRLFRERDAEASRQQNRYRKFQLSYIALALLATMLGSLQGLVANSGNMTWLAVAAFFETLIALLATFMVTIANREPPLPGWITSRRRAEGLRQEYFRYLMHADPYDTIEDLATRKMLLSKRAAEINRGNYPDQSAGGAQ